jgi:hypothetical protein
MIKIVNVYVNLCTPPIALAYISRIDKLKLVEKSQRQARLTQQTLSLPVTILQNNFFWNATSLCKVTGVQFI